MSKILNTVYELHLVSEALRHLGETLPEQFGGVAYMIKKLSQRIAKLSEELNELNE